MSDLPPSSLPPPPPELQTRSRVVPAVAVGTTSALAFQFGGSAAWAIAFGLIALVTPFVSSFYFRIFPIAGVISGVRALMHGRLIGGGIGLALNVVAALLALIASGLLSH
jgi:hypothetical protein